MSLGTIASVDAVPLGSELAQPANIGDTTLALLDAADFYSTGGYLLLAGVIYQFTAVDGDADIVTLGDAVAEITGDMVAVSDIVDFTVTGGIVSTTLPVTVVSPGIITMALPPGSTSSSPPAAGEAVYVWDNLAGKIAVQVQASVFEQGTDTPIIALVDPGVFPYLPLGPRDQTTGQSEGCRLAEDAAGRWRLTAITGRASTYSSEFAQNIRTSGDGNPPAASPTANVSGGIGSLFLDWTANTDSISLVTYDVHVSPTSGFTPSPADLVLSTTGTYAVITQLADGTPLGAYSGPYYVVLVSNNVDGTATPGPEASGSPRIVSGPDIDVDWVYANGIEANQIKAGIVTAPLILGSSLKTATTGARVEVDAAGERIYDPSGNLVANLSTVAGDAYVSGNADLGSLTTEGPTTFLGPVEVANGVTQTLDSIFAPGTNAPTCSCSYIGSSNSGGFGGQPQEWLALNYSASASQMYGYIAHAFSGGKRLQIWTVDGSGNSVALVASSHVVSANYQLLGAGVVGTTHWFYLTDSSGNARWYNNSSGASTVVDTAGANSDVAAGTADGTNLWTANAAGANIVVKKWDPANLAGSPLSTTTITKPANLSALWGIYVGAGDFSTSRIILSLEMTDTHGAVTRQMLSYGFGGTPQPNDAFPAAVAGSNGGLAYDGTNFWSPCFFTVVRYEGGAHVLGTGATAPWAATYTWRDDANGYESAMSTNPRTFTMKSRAAVVMNGMNVPAGADHLGFYIGPGSNRTAQWLQGESTGAPIVLAAGEPQDLTLSGTHPPITGTFPTSAPGGIVSGATDGNGPLVKLYGDGTYRLAGTNLDDVAWTNLGNGSRYRVKNGVVYAYVNNSAFTTPAGTSTVISTSAIPADYRPSGPAYGAGYFAGTPGLFSVGTDGNLYALQQSGGPTVNISGLVSYPVGL